MISNQPFFADPKVLTFDYWKEYINKYDPEGDHNLWGYALPMATAAYKEALYEVIEWLGIQEEKVYDATYIIYARDLLQSQVDKLWPKAA